MLIQYPISNYETKDKSTYYITIYYYTTLHYYNYYTKNTNCHNILR